MIISHIPLKKVYSIRNKFCRCATVPIITVAHLRVYRELLLFKEPGVSATRLRDPAVMLVSQTEYRDQNENLRQHTDCIRIPRNPGFLARIARNYKRKLAYPFEYAIFRAKVNTKALPSGLLIPFARLVFTINHTFSATHGISSTTLSNTEKVIDSPG